MIFRRKNPILLPSASLLVVLIGCSDSPSIPVVSLQPRQSGEQLSRGDYEILNCVFDHFRRKYQAETVMTTSTTLSKSHIWSRGDDFFHDVFLDRFRVDADEFHDAVVDTEIDPEMVAASTTAQFYSEEPDKPGVVTVFITVPVLSEEGVALIYYFYSHDGHGGDGLFSLTHDQNEWTIKRHLPAGIACSLRADQ